MLLVVCTVYVFTGGSTIVIVPAEQFGEPPVMEKRWVALPTLDAAVLLSFPSITSAPPDWLKFPAVMEKFPFRVIVPPDRFSVPLEPMPKVALFPAALATVREFPAATLSVPVADAGTNPVKLPMYKALTLAVEVSERFAPLATTKLSALLIVAGDAPEPSVAVPQEATSLKSVAEALEK